MYAANLSCALIFSAILSAISMGIRLFAPAAHRSFNYWNCFDDRKIAILLSKISKTVKEIVILPNRDSPLVLD